MGMLALQKAWHKLEMLKFLLKNTMHQIDTKMQATKIFIFLNRKATQVFIYLARFAA